MRPIFSFFWHNKVLFYLALIAGCIIAFSPAEAGLQPQLNDKFLHVVGFSIMALFCHLAHPNTAYWLQILGLALFGAGIELVQAYLPYRSFSIWDWLADIVGLFIYFGLLASPFISYLRGRFALD